MVSSRSSCCVALPHRPLLNVAHSPWSSFDRSWFFLNAQLTCCMSSIGLSFPSTTYRPFLVVLPHPLCIYFCNNFIAIYFVNPSSRLPCLFLFYFVDHSSPSSCYTLSTMFLPTIFVALYFVDYSLHHAVLHRLLTSCTHHALFH